MRIDTALCLSLALVITVCSGCQRSAAPPPDASKTLNAILHDFDEAELREEPLLATFRGDHRYDHRLGSEISAEADARRRAMNQQALDALLAIDSAALSEVDRESYAIFRYQRERELRFYGEGHARLQRLLPVEHFDSLPGLLAAMGSGDSIQPFATEKDYRNWLQRAAELPRWVDQAIAAMREGMQENITQPRIVIERLIAQLDDIATIEQPLEKNIFFRPLGKMPDSIDAAQRSALEQDYRQLINSTLQPALLKLRNFLANEYLPKARATVGLSELPGGKAWYAFLVEEMTTTTLSVEQIHQLGEELVGHLQSEMRKLQSAYGVAGELPAFFAFVREDPQFQYTSAEAMLQAYRDLKQRVDARVPTLFNTTPKAGYEVRPTEAFRERTAAGAEYMPPSLDGTRPGIFYVNTWDLPSRSTFDREALFTHEAVPGHHFQIAIAQQQTGLPLFRREVDFTAYTEGWGLYAESLGEELGLYQDKEQYLGYASLSLFRAARLVVDTGIHDRGWTREQAIEYFLLNTPLSETEATAEVERYIAWPAQSLAYMIGKLQFIALRERSEATLGERFDIRAFHDQVLLGGAMPLAMLEQRVHRWIMAERREASPENKP